VIAYILQMVSFVRLRLRYPLLHRPYRSPLGISGAVLGMLIAGITLVTLFLNPDYRPGLLGAAVWFLLGILWFAFGGHQRLVLAPEEQFAEEARAGL
jgi:ethanolamine permease